MKRLRNEKGLTLAELLAVFVVSSIVLTLVISVLVFVQKQYKTQTADAQHLTDISIAVKSITRDIRMAEEGEIEVLDGNLLSFVTRDIHYVWDSNSKILKKNNVNYIYEVVDFEIFPNGPKKTGDPIGLLIKSSTGQQIETEIIIR